MTDLRSFDVALHGIYHIAGLGLDQADDGHARVRIMSAFTIRVEGGPVKVLPGQRITYRRGEGGKETSLPILVGFGDFSLKSGENVMVQVEWGTKAQQGLLPESALHIASSPAMACHHIEEAMVAGICAYARGGEGRAFQFVRVEPLA